MKKFLVLYRAPASSFQQMQKATPEQQKAGMEAWMTWSKKAAASIVDMGSPLGKSLRVTEGSSSPIPNDLGGFSIMQADSKEALAQTMSGHPHFTMPDGSIGRWEWHFCWPEDLAKGGYPGREWYNPFTQSHGFATDGPLEGPGKVE